MKKSEIEKQTQNILINKYEAYHTGTLSRDDYVSYLLDLLENFIKQRIGVKKRFISAEYEDLMQQGRLAVIAKADSYDPHCGMPTSYFTYYIDQYMKEALNNDGMTRYYVGTATKLEKVAKEYGYEGCTDPRLSPDKLAILADTSLMTVLETIKYKNQSTVSLDEWNGVSSDFETPENMLILKERDELLSKQFSKCTELEKFLLTNIVMRDKPMSFRALIKNLNTDEMQEKFKDELPKCIDQIYLENKLNCALRQMQRNRSVSDYLPKKKNQWERLIEQATAEDIENAIESNLLEL